MSDILPRDQDFDIVHGSSGAMVPPCFHCTHLRTSGSLDAAEGWTCDAFPDGIGYDILQRLETHETPLPLDNGIVYESKEFVLEGERRYVIDWAGNSLAIER